MALRGVKYDVGEGLRFAERLERDRQRWQACLDGRIGHEVNVYSHPQICKLLYEELKLPMQWVYDKKKRKRRITTGQGKLLSLYPTLKSRRLRKILKSLLMVRRARKMLSTYVAPKRPILGPDNRIRTSLNVVGAETGRWSASMFLINMEGTNLQTVPPSWKKCFIADEGKLLGYADYAQIEAVLVAYDAEDLSQIRLIEHGESDLHYENAARILGKPVSEVSRVERQVVGKSSHALNYDVGPATLAEFINKKGLDTGIWVTTAYTAAIKDQYRSKYRGVLRWQQRTWDECRRTGRLTNHLGRTPILLGLKKGDYSYITRGESLAYVPQSDVPDILDIAIVKIINDKVMYECGVELLLQVHDALLVQGDEDKVEIWKPRLAELMVYPICIHGRTCSVPVDVNTGVRWSELT